MKRKGNWLFLLLFIIILIVVFISNSHKFVLIYHNKNGSFNYNLLEWKIYTKEEYKTLLCQTNMRSLTSALEMFIQENPTNIESVVKNFTWLRQYMNIQKFPKCPDGGKYSVEKDDKGYYYIHCSVHGDLPYSKLTRLKNNPHERE